MTLARPPGEADLELFCSLEGLSDLTPALVRSHSPDLVLAHGTDGRVRARVSLWWSHVPPHRDERLGLIGHYAAQDRTAADGILELSCATLAGHGCTLAVGPIDGSTWRRYRLLTERGTEPPFLLEPDNPDDWPQHFETAGFRPLARYYSSINEDNSRGMDFEAMLRRSDLAGYRLRPLERADIDAELDRLWQLSGEAFQDNYLYTPISKPEFMSLYGPLVGQVRPELVQIADWQGMAVAFCLALPNLLQAGRDPAVDTVIVKSLAVVPAHRGKGLAGVLLAHINRTARALGMHRTIHALMHEDNPSRRLNRPVMRDFRCYTLYARAL